MRAVQQVIGWLAPGSIPILAYHLEISGNAPGGDHDTFTCGCELPARAFIDARAAGEIPGSPNQVADSMLKEKRELVPIRVVVQMLEQAEHKTLSGAPDNVKTRHGVSGLLQTAFG